MTRNRMGISRLAATAALLVAALGCEADGAKNPGQQLASPVTPLASQHVSISSSRLTLTVGRDDVFAVLTVQALAPDFSALPNGTDVVLTTNLGAFDSPSGPQTITLDLVGGKATARFYPGSTEGSARVTATVNGVSATVIINIRPDPTGGLPPEPAPTESTLTVTASPSTISEEDAVDDGAGPTTVTITATVLGTDGDPFQGAGVFFTTPLGTFTNGSATSAILTTSSAGKVTETLSIEDNPLLDFGGSSFQVTAHLGIVGGEKTTAVTITIVAGPAPAEATSVTLFVLPDATVDDDGGGDSVTLRAVVRDQFDALFSGATVFFSTQLGNLSAASDVTDGSGAAEVTLTLSDAQLSTFGPDGFTVTADILVDSDTKVITIARTAESFEASFTANTTAPCNDSADGVTTVQFTDTSTGAILSWSWDLDGNNLTTDSNVADPLFDYEGFAADVGVNVTLVISDGVVSDSFSMIITPTDCL